VQFIEDKIYITGVNNTRIHIKKFVPLSYKKVFLVFHGICEHSGRYQNLTDYFLKKNSALYLMDHRGHGLSEGDRGNIEDIDYYVQDALNALRLVKSSENKPIFIIAHSMGGLIITFASLLYKKEFESIRGIILSSPAYRIKNLPENFENTFMKISKFLKNYYLRSLAAPEKYINDPSEIENFRKDDLIVKKLSPKFYSELMKAILYCNNNIENFSKPVLFLIAGHDNLIDPGTILNHYQRIYLEDKSKIIYPNSFHDLLNDLYRNKIFSDIELWAEKRISKMSIFSIFKSKS